MDSRSILYGLQIASQNLERMQKTAATGAELAVSDPNPVIADPNAPPDPAPAESNAG